MGLLKSKIVVGILVLFAVGAISKNIVLPIYESIISSTPERKVTIGTSAPEQESAPVSSAGYMKSLDWILDFKRDPFKTTQFLPENTIKLVGKKVEPKSGPKKQRQRLVGVLVEPSGRYAVINDEIVVEGDRYKGYEVVKIGGNSVLLKGPDGYKTLRF